MINYKYFFHGTANPILYGLYSPSAECFLFTCPYLEILESLMFILSSKITLFIIRLDTIENFPTNQIDNNVCTEWTIDNVPQDRTISLPLTVDDYLLTDCGKLVPNNIEIDPKLIEIRKFLFLSYYVVIFFKHKSSMFYRKAYDIIDFPFDDLQQLKNKERNCYQALYRGIDFDLTENKITQILEGLPWK